ncbi:transforming growth factor beta-1-induced transcript 1 protein-like isoform X2 [Harmonia axyridis]|uniref:transforming growth factor beta-1-induced transcript 1 protein-like isoform X2 n=1 Tax=Harmonia axyridis TaxID=115357 RepID=UPI001E278AE7|nr:transforming growth factor beta-1-induced transcript 1 protein-like isoform X2 [Harmonia axyridis]
MADAPKICGTCKKSIEGGVLTALEKSYHPDHFICIKCATPIRDAKFHQRDGIPYCISCHAKYLAPKCNSCIRSIDGKAVAAMGGHFHPDHFTCESCKSPLIGKQFVDVEGKPYCTDCHANKICPKCKACGKPITTKATIALDAKWHQFCFKCKKCGKPMMLDQQFKVDDGLPKCLTC